MFGVTRALKALFVVFVVLLHLLVQVPALSAEPTKGKAPTKTSSGSAGAASVRLGQYQDWTVYRYGKGQDKLCYIGSFPLNDAGVPAGYSSYVLMTAFVKGSAEFSTSIPNKAGHTISAKIDNGDKILLHTEGSMGWAMDSEADARLASAMRRGRYLYVSVPLAQTGQTQPKNKKSATPERIDRYSLLGFTAAYKHMQGSCN